MKWLFVYYTLLRGNSKKRLKPVMIDCIRKVENYKKELIASGHDDWFDIQEAEKDAVVWRKHNRVIPSSVFFFVNASLTPCLKTGECGWESLFSSGT